MDFRGERAQNAAEPWMSTENLLRMPAHPLLRDPYSGGWARDPGAENRQ